MIDLWGHEDIRVAKERSAARDITLVILHSENNGLSKAKYKAFIYLFIYLFIYFLFFINFFFQGEITAAIFHFMYLGITTQLEWNILYTFSTYNSIHPHGLICLSRKDNNSSPV